jgi:segregation and condensation protein B
MSEIKKKIEAVLYSIGRYISLEEIAKVCGVDIHKAKEALRELQTDYETNEKSSLVVLNDGEIWKLTTREEYGNIVRKVVTETELTKSVLETLAVIAFKYPIKQSDLIRIRTNKAYDHLTELENGGFITRQKYGRTRLIKLTDKFFDYFDLPQDKLKERFKGFHQLANTIEKKETEIEDVKEKQKIEAEETKKQDEIDKKIRDGKIEIDLIEDDGKKDKLDVYNADVPESKEKESTEESEGEEKPEEEKLKSVDDVLGTKEEEHEEKKEESKE